MLDARSEVEHHLQWIIGKGDVDVSRDKWLSIYFPTLDERLSVKSLFPNDNELNAELASSLLGNNICERIDDEHISLNLSDDRLCWTKSSDGTFNIKFAREMIK